MRNLTHHTGAYTWLTCAYCAMGYPPASPAALPLSHAHGGFLCFPYQPPVRILVPQTRITSRLITTATDTTAGTSKLSCCASVRGHAAPLCLALTSGPP